MLQKSARVNATNVASTANTLPEKAAAGPTFLATHVVKAGPERVAPISSSVSAVTARAMHVAGGCELIDYSGRSGQSGNDGNSGQYVFFLQLQMSASMWSVAFFSLFSDGKTGFGRSGAGSDGERGYAKSSMRC